LTQNGIKLRGASYGKSVLEFSHGCNIHWLLNVSSYVQLAAEQISLIVKAILFC
jgi:hypothetical protein